jgi:hypothetical protein
MMNCLHQGNGVAAGQVRVSTVPDASLPSQGGAEVGGRQIHAPTDQNRSITFSRDSSLPAASEENNMTNKLDLHRQSILTRVKAHKSYFNHCCTEIDLDLFQRCSVYFFSRACSPVLSKSPRALISLCAISQQFRHPETRLFEDTNAPAT